MPLDDCRSLRKILIVQPSGGSRVIVLQRSALHRKFKLLNCHMSPTVVRAVPHAGWDAQAIVVAPYWRSRRHHHTISKLLLTLRTALARFMVVIINDSTIVPLTFEILQVLVPMLRRFNTRSHENTVTTM